MAQNNKQTNKHKQTKLKQNLRAKNKICVPKTKLLLSQAKICKNILALWAVPPATGAGIATAAAVAVLLHASSHLGHQLVTEHYHQLSPD